MADLAQPFNAQTIQAGVAEREAASAAIRAQDNAALGGRSDTHASQTEAAREVSFNPANEVAAGGDTLAANIHGGSQGGSVAGASGVAGLPGSGQRDAQQQGSADTDWESLIDAAKGLGYAVPEGDTDDRRFLLGLLNQAQARQQEDYYSQLGRQLAPHYQGIQGYLQQQKSAAPAQKPEWEAPEFDQRWLGLVDRDAASGMFIGKPGVNPAVADQVNAYDKWFQKYGTNPQAAVRPMLEAELPKMLGNIIEQKFSEWNRNQTISGIVQRNSEWMYQSNTDGRPVIGVGGQPVPTPAGMRYGQLVGQLERGGMSDPVLVDGLARNLLMGEMAMGQLQAGKQQSPVQQQQAALASGRPQANVLQSLTPQQRMVTPGATEPSSEGMSLAELLRKNLDEAGFSEADFQNMPFSAS